MLKELKGNRVAVQEGELLRREQDNRTYLMKLENRYLLRNYLLEAGRISGIRCKEAQARGMGGSQLSAAGTFSGTLAVGSGDSLS